MFFIVEHVEYLSRSDVPKPPEYFDRIAVDLRFKGNKKYGVPYSSVDSLVAYSLAPLFTAAAAALLPTASLAAHEKGRFQS